MQVMGQYTLNVKRDVGKGWELDDVREGKGWRREVREEGRWRREERKEGG